MLTSTLSDIKLCFGHFDEVCLIARLPGAANRCGDNPQTEAIYINAVPGKKYAKTLYQRMAQGDPVQGFWPVSLYNKTGDFEKNTFNS